MDSWRPDRLLRLILAWSALTFIGFWLPAIRGFMDGPSYAWGTFGFSGYGTAGDYWFPVAGSVFAVTMLWLGWRGARRPFHWLLLAWHGVLAAGATRLALTDPDMLRFRGDSLGIDWSLAWLGPLLFGGFAAAATVWVIRDLRRGGTRRPVWNAVNTRVLIAAAALVPVQFFLLRVGDPHGTTDQLGVLLTLGQWFLISAAFYPWREKALPAPGRLVAPPPAGSAPQQATWWSTS